MAGERGRGRGSPDRQVPECFAGQYGPLGRLGLLLTGDWAQAEELAQETLVGVWRRWPQVRRQQHPEAYARTVLVNQHRSLLRRRQRRAARAGHPRPRRQPPATAGSGGYRAVTAAVPGM